MDLNLDLPTGKEDFSFWYYNDKELKFNDALIALIYVDDIKTNMI